MTFFKKLYVRNTLIILLAVLALIFIAFWFRPVTVSQEHKKCQADSDCRRVSLTCGDCDCGPAVNIKYFNNYHGNSCRWPSGKICDIYCTEEAKCVQNICTLVERQQK